MLKKIIFLSLGVALVSLTLSGCKTPAIVGRNANGTVPLSYANSLDTLNSARVKWRDYFSDPYLVTLIDTALRNNQELNITLQEIQIAQNEVMARKGEYLPFVDLGGGAAVDKVSRYTNIGASEAATEIAPGKETPDPLQNYMVGAFASWEIDIWHKLRNARKSAMMRYLGTIEGKNFMVTHLIAEIANSYYELLALDNQLEIVKQNIKIQSDALLIVRQQKEATRVTELAVRRFEAQVLHTRGLQYDIQQQIVEMENRINFLVGRFPQPVQRDFQIFSTLTPGEIQAGLPAQLLANRPDIRQAELNLAASKLDVTVARANFYPRLNISAAIGLQAFNPTFLVKAPESILFSLAGDMAGPLINKNAIKATYFSANSRQIQAAYDYERTILMAYIEVVNQLSNINNLEQRYSLKAQEVQALTQSITISGNLFRSARADYMEVLLTQRDALESRFDLIETKKRQMNAKVDIYQALGGGWN